MVYQGRTEWSVSSNGSFTVSTMRIAIVVLPFVIAACALDGLDRWNRIPGYHTIVEEIPLASTLATSVLEEARFLVLNVDGEPDRIFSVWIIASPDSTQTDLRSMIWAVADEVGSLARDREIGTGVLNACPGDVPSRDCDRCEMRWTAE